jgi:hypothetical protein
MSLASSLQKVANKTISRLGGDITLRLVTTGEYNPLTGSVSETVTGVTVKGVIESVNAREVNDLVQADDKKLTIAASSISSVPSTEDRIIIQNVTHQVIQVETIEQDNTAIVFILFLRS